MMSSSPSALLRKGGLALAAIVLVSTGVIYLSGDDSAAAPRVDLVSAERGTVVSAVSAAGTTVDNGVRDLSFTSEGKVQKIYVSIGDKVTKGDILARIDNTAAKENYTAAAATLAAAEDALENPTSTGTTTGTTTGSGAGNASGSGDASASSSGSSGSGSGSSCPPSDAGKPSANPTAKPTATGRPSGAAQPSPSAAPGAPVGVEPALPGSASDSAGTPDSPGKPGSAGGGDRPSDDVGLVIQTQPPAPRPSPTPTVTPTPSAAPACTGTQGSQSNQGGQGSQSGQGGGSGGGAQGGRVLSEAELEANVSKATTDLAEAKEALAGVTIKAPAAGTVLSIAGTVDTDYTTGTFITLGDLDNLQVHALFTQSDIGHLKIGQPAEITLTTDQTTSHPGKVSHIDPTATTTGKLVQYGVTITFDTHPDALLLGQSATVQVTTAEAANTLYVPARAVQTGQDGTTTVTTQSGQKKPVHTGIRSDLYIEITNGLTEGDQITLPTDTTTNGFPDSTFPG
ncbi:hypothetical protein Acor_80030 [Acrocarpospora corrugata]|uniref:Uncharacterized protein n=1 Tax=Acrocarpospora corrugata TaxID=35763 RepID=A0A5M3WAJ6_9ACTN|nr:efflux RND transporter periplasmic adaptor subunit [Acrocarpospora corrugata]GES05934.1 hypothetical protein Acor_80030 [Acrocarpospora corrugata]